jgi:hypothetical protein
MKPKMDSDRASVPVIGNRRLRGGSSYLRIGGRWEDRLSAEPLIIPAIYVKTFLMGQKTIINGAEAVAEAACPVDAQGTRRWPGSAESVIPPR